MLRKTLRKRNKHPNSNTRRNVPNLYEVYSRYSFPNSLPHSKLTYLGSGSYGTIYATGDRYVLKEHIININSIDICPEWKHEYTMHSNIYSLCNNALIQYGVSIVKPFQFSYATHDDGHLLLQNTPEGAKSCLYTMERLPGRVPTSKCFEYALSKILRSGVTLAPTNIPPYLFLGSVQPLHGHITLDMLEGAKLIELPKESMNYCIVDSIALSLLRSTCIAFFTIIMAGYMPRDIEFLFNGICGPIRATIIDFNEVSTLEDRAKGRVYDLEEDIAHVYIDLCGLRSSFEDPNPQAPYNSPTPQWKFLCNPLVSPNGFFECCNSIFRLGALFSIKKMIEYIHDYVHKNYFSIVQNKLKGKYKHVLDIWHPSTHFSTSNGLYKPFDIEIQKYFIAGLLDTLAHRNIEPPSSLPNDYPSALTMLIKLNTKRILENDMWVDPFRLF
jgi:hypothetical protein